MEARRIAQENALLAQATDSANIRQLLKAREGRLAQKAAVQVAGEQAAQVSCVAVAFNPTQQSESVAWWNVEFECRWPGDQLPSPTSISVRLAKTTHGWVPD